MESINIVEAALSESLLFKASDDLNSGLSSFLPQQPHINIIILKSGGKSCSSFISWDARATETVLFMNNNIASTVAFKTTSHKTLLDCTVSYNQVPWFK